MMMRQAFRIESRVSIELSHTLRLCAALREHARKLASAPFATSSRDHGGARASAAPARAALRVRLCFLPISANKRLGAARCAAPSLARSDAHLRPVSRRLRN